MRIGSNIKLIDMDASTCYTKQQCMGAKYSSGYIPPEMVYVEEIFPSIRRGKVKSHKNYEQSQMISIGTTIDRYNKSFIFDLVLSSPQQDVWSFGVVLYHLCTGETLFHCDNHDNIDEDNLVQLHDWTSDFKQRRLSKISNALAKNLISQLLVKDTKHRLPSMSQVLKHPLFKSAFSSKGIGILPANIQHSPKYDVFISYRVNSDLMHALYLHHLLSHVHGLSVFLDKLCLQPGVPWEEGFCNGVISSTSFVCIISKNAINMPNNNRQNFTLLEENSPCDNVLLEMRLALELREMGFIRYIYPILVGNVIDVDTSLSSLPQTQTPSVNGLSVQDQLQITFSNYSNYFKDSCYPTFTASPTPSRTVAYGGTVVSAVESKLQEHLERLGLGTPLFTSPEDIATSNVLSHVLANQGGFIEGLGENSFNKVVGDICQMITLKLFTNNSKISMSSSISNKPPSGGGGSVLRMKVAILEERLNEKDNKILKLEEMLKKYNIAF